jgi:hypothetical protein
MTIELKATETDVHAVTVYRAQRAEITRKFTVDLKVCLEIVAKRLLTLVYRVHRKARMR